MSGFEEQTALLEEYEKWKGEKKVSANDFSPTAFLVERAQKAAYGELEPALEKITWLEDKLRRIKEVVTATIPDDFKDYGQGNDVRKIVNEVQPEELDEF